MDSERQRWSIDHWIRNGWISVGPAIYGYHMTKDNDLIIVPKEAEVVRRIFDMFISGMGVSAIAKILNTEGLTTVLGRQWKPNNISFILENEKYKGDSIMGKTVVVNGVQASNRDGALGKKYYLEGTHEPIVSKEIWEKAQAIREERANPKVIGCPKPEYAFTGLIECAQCHSHYNHKVNSSGTKWSTDIWLCLTSLRKGVRVCDNSRIKNSVLEEKFIEAYNEFVTERPEGRNTILMQNRINRLRAEERDLAALTMKHLLPDATFRSEQKRIKDEIAASQVQDISFCCYPTINCAFQYGLTSVSTKSYCFTDRIAHITKNR